MTKRSSNPQSVDAIAKQYELPPGKAGEDLARHTAAAFVKGINKAQKCFAQDVTRARREAKSTGKTVRDVQKAGATDTLAHSGVLEHGQKVSLVQFSFYPEHNQRKESKLYAKSHHLLAIAQDRPCLACGVRNSTLGDASENRFGAKAMETHHHVVEWALANGVDPKRFFNHVVRALASKKANGDTGLDPEFSAHYGTTPAAQKAWTAALISAWVDHSTDNLWVLCDVHHRHRYLGIHAITDPIWGPMDVINDDLSDKGFVRLAKNQDPEIPVIGGGGSTGGKKRASKTAGRKKAAKKKPASKKKARAAKQSGAGRKTRKKP